MVLSWASVVLHVHLSRDQGIRANVVEIDVAKRTVGEDSQNVVCAFYFVAGI